ncbi:Hemin transport system permease protein HmuU [Planctomycetes bacterium Pan216]|uniref:Hemin transport system permease protein HmuU n=1 Tax=Kolteria novifilia TaxID=2527975 RepID=A0A518B8N3_9BACT|nr:Hemin transport system permease protein HmuU [Planctomycetes bacterium Pan216]
MSRAWRLGMLGALVAGLAFLSCAVGRATISVESISAIVIHALTRWNVGSWEPWQATIVWEIRLPRTVIAILVGGGLGLAGAVMQGLFRNPLADPGLLGVSSGGAFGAVLAVYTGLAAYFALAVPILALCFAIATGLTVYVVATMRGHPSTATLLLAGIAMTAIASAGTAALLSFSLSRWDVAREMIAWLLGGLNGRSWTDVVLVGPLVVGGYLYLHCFANDLDALAGGEEVASSLGIDVPIVRRNLLMVASAVTAATVAVSGVLAFVGLIVPHIIRLLFGPAHRWLLPGSFLGGAALLLIADLIARTVTSGELRLGILTSLLGGPFFFLLLLRRATD